MQTRPLKFQCVHHLVFRGSQTVFVKKLESLESLKKVSPSPSNLQAAEVSICRQPKMLRSGSQVRRGLKLWSLVQFPSICIWYLMRLDNIVALLIHDFLPRIRNLVVVHSHPIGTVFLALRRKNIHCWHFGACHRTFEPKI